MLTTYISVSFVDPVVPRGWRDVLKEKGPEGFARAVRDHKGLILFLLTYWQILPFTHNTSGGMSTNCLSDICLNLFLK